MLSPSFVPRLSVSVDYFRMQVTGGSSPLCGLIVRPISCCDTSLANTATEYLIENVNIGSIKTSGMRRRSSAAFATTAVGAQEWSAGARGQ